MYSYNSLTISKWLGTYPLILYLNEYFFLLIRCNFLKIHLYKYYKLNTTLKIPMMTSWFVVSYNKISLEYLRFEAKNKLTCKYITY